MIHHFYAMGGAIPYARTALKSVGDYIKTVLTPTNSLTEAGKTSSRIAPPRAILRPSS